MNPQLNDPAVSVRGLRKSYGGRVVVHDLDLDVGAGEVVGLIDANGPGKTTTVECLQGLRRPNAGTVRVLGLDPTHDAPQLGSQQQDSGLPDRLRVHEAVTLSSNAGAHDDVQLPERLGPTWFTRPQGPDKRADQQGDQAPQPRGGHLPQQRRRHRARRSGPARHARGVDRRRPPLPLQGIHGQALRGQR